MGAQSNTSTCKHRDRKNDKREHPARDAERAEYNRNKIIKRDGNHWTKCRGNAAVSPKEPGKKEPGNKQ